MRCGANILIQPISSSTATSTDHTIRRSVIVLTIHPTPATSVNYPANSLASVSRTPEMIRKGDGMYLLVPSQQHAPTHISPARKSHTLV